MIQCPNCHQEFELSSALTHDIEERIRKENANEVQKLRGLAQEAQTLKANQQKLLSDAIHKAKLEASQEALREKESLFRQIETLKTQHIKSEEEYARAIAQARAQAKKETLEQANAIVKKRIEEAKEQARLEQQAQMDQMRLNLEMATNNAQQQEKNFKEMLDQQKAQFEQNKLQQKSFFEQQLNEQREMLQRDIAQRERELVSRTKLEAELKIKEQEEMIRKLSAQVHTMKETADNRSQQLQGEALETLIEEKLLREPNFRLDSFSEVKKGANGVDVTMTVQTQRGEICGIVMIEAKRAANWSNGWIEKIKRDRIESGAKEAVCLIVSTRLRQEHILVDDLGDGVWATVPEYFIHFIQIIRKSMEEMHRIQKANIDRGDKKELLYSYVHSDTFRSKVQAMTDYHENIYSQGVKIQRSMKKMLDTIVKSREMGDDLFVEIGTAANLSLLPGMEEPELIDMEGGAHKEV